MVSPSKNLIKVNYVNNNLIDYTGSFQHGFKKDRSTSTAGLTLQSILAYSMDNNLFTKRERSPIFSALKKASFLKSMLLPNFAFDVIYTGN